MIAGALFRLAEALHAEGDFDQAMKVAQEAEINSGLTFGNLRDRALRLRQTKNKTKIDAFKMFINFLITRFIDWLSFIVSSPSTASRAVIYRFLHHLRIQQNLETEKKDLLELLPRQV